jgi:hypothetical protein
MLMVAPEACNCRKCGVNIAKGEHFSFSGGPHHLACTPDTQDWEMAKAANFYRPQNRSQENTGWTTVGTIAAFLYAAVPIAVLLWALAPGHAYSYFIFLRVVVCACAALFAMMFFDQQRKHWLFAFVAIALLYNPFLRVHLTRDIWIVLNLLTVAAFVAGFAALWFEARRGSRK